MNEPVNLTSLRTAVELLEKVSADGRLLALKNLALNNGGRWDLPGTLTDADGKPKYQPLLLSIQLHGVFAMADELDELAKNWLLAAKRILTGEAVEGAA